MTTNQPLAGVAGIAGPTLLQPGPTPNTSDSGQVSLNDPYISSVPGDLTNQLSSYDPTGGSGNFGATLPGMPNVAGTGSNTGTADSSFLSGLGSDLSSFLSGIPIIGSLFGGNGSGLSGLGPYAAVGALGMSEAGKARSQGEQYGQALQAEGAPFQAAAQAQLAQYNSGQLLPWQQQTITDFTTSSSQQVKQLLANSGISDSSALASQSQQIQSQAITMTGQYMNQALTNAQSLMGTAAPFLMGAVQTEMQADQNYANSVQQFMASLAQAYAYQTAGKASGGGTGTAAGGGGSSGSGISGIAKQVGGLLGGTTTIPGFSDFFNNTEQDASNIAQAGADAAIDSNWADILGNPSTAGGEAAASLGLTQDATQAINTAGLNAAMPNAQDAASLQADINNLQEPGMPGVQGAPGGSFNLGSAVSDLGSAASIYSGIEKGGVAGYGSAAVNAAKLGGNLLGNSAVSGVAGDIAAPLAVYNFVENWKSGATGKDALSGAEAGAAIGSIVPGLGTVVGGVIGGLVGAASSAFGSKDTNKEAWKGWASGGGQQAANPGKISPTGLLDVVGGLFRAGDPNFPGTAKFGNNGNKFTAALGNQIAGAISSGKISKTADYGQVYSQVVVPWIESMGNWNTNPEAKYGEATMMLSLTYNYMNGRPITWGESQGGKADFAYTPISQVQVKS